jgi:histidinol dehydrogenase
MIPIVTSTEKAFTTTLNKITERASRSAGKVEMAVRRILKAVQRSGDAAVSRYAKKFDRVLLKPMQFRVSPQQIKEAYYQIRKEEGDALRYAAQRIMAFHERQRVRTWMYQDNGTTLGQMVLPMDSVGLYVPGGKAAYPSTVLMCAIPAKVAGVKRVVMCTPAFKGRISPYLLVAADIAGVDEVYRIGGVQAVGAMAYGTKTIARVDKIVGPGNIFVATAKRLLYGTVAVDMVAGPSELLVVADEHANPAHVAADLLCEAEHDEDAQVWLVTVSVHLAREVVRHLEEQVKRLMRRSIIAQALARHGAALVVSNMEEAVAVANQIAPEHLALTVERPFDFVEKVRHAGAIFLGRYTPPAVADYIAGPNHVLPTGGSARFFSPLSVDDFVKRSSIIAYSKNELVRVKDYVNRIATMEGLDAHAKSLESRFS